MVPETIYTPDEIAKHLKVTVDAVLAEIDGGRLQALTVGGLKRIRESALTAFMNEVFDDGPQRQQVKLDLRTTEDFMFTWPDKLEERFLDAREGVVSYANRTHHIKIGFTTREVAGKNRKRLVVFVDRYPTVEFVAAGTDDRNGHMVSILKDRTRRQVPVGATPPTEYVDVPLVPYRDVVDGPGALNGMAVRCRPNDLATMVQHALIRRAYQRDRAAGSRTRKDNETINIDADPRNRNWIRILEAKRKKAPAEQAEIPENEDAVLAAIRAIGRRKTTESDR